MDPVNVDWVESREDRSVSRRLGLMEEFLFQNIRRIVREEVRAALAESAASKATTTTISEGEYLSVSEAATIARLHHGTIREWIKDGSLKSCRAGRVYRIRRGDLDDRLAASVAEPVAAKVEDCVSAILAKQAKRAA
jgi:excisionase family DNA binding protein